MNSELLDELCRVIKTLQYRIEGVRAMNTLTILPVLVHCSYLMTVSEL